MGGFPTSHHKPWQKMKTPSPVPCAISKPFILLPFPLEIYKSRGEVETGNISNSKFSGRDVVFSKTSKSPPGLEQQDWGLGNGSSAITRCSSVKRSWYSLAQKETFNRSGAFKVPAESPLRPQGA